MSATKFLFDFSQIDEITAGDLDFKKELIGIFISQIPEFIQNMNDALANNNFEFLARESHSAKSSVLIFGMDNTGKLLKQIEAQAKEKIRDGIPIMLEEAENNLKQTYSQLTALLENL